MSTEPPAAALQLRPWSVDRPATPSHPTTTATESALQPALSVVGVPRDTLPQAAPPFVERRMVPDGPTATVVEPDQPAAKRSIVVPLPTGLQVAPPSVERR